WRIVFPYQDYNCSQVLCNLRAAMNMGSGRRVREMFQERVLKWTLHDIMDENYLHHKVKHIPDRFMSVEEYLDSFVWPVIEETRAQLQQSLESVAEAQYATITFQDEIQLSEGVVEKYEMLVDRETDTGGEKKGQQNLKFKPMDILILSTKLPEILDDFRDDYLLSLVHSIDVQETSSTDCQDTSLDELKVKIYVRCGHPFTSKNYNLKRKYFAIYLGSIASSLRIWNALHTPLEDGEKNWAMLNKAIYFNTEGHNKAFAGEKGDGFEKFRSKHFASLDLNDSQASAVIQAVNAVETNCFYGIKLIQGPPGTGKTSMLISLLSILVHKGSKVLVCAPTNAAVSEIAMRFMKIVTSPPGCCPDTDNFPCIMSLSDLVLVGNEERFDSEGLFADIFLTYRVVRLYECFLPKTGWTYRVTSLIDFLESAVSWHKVFQEKPQKTGSIAFSQYVREELKTLTLPFCEGARTLLNDLPGTFSGKEELECLIKIVESFVNLIAKSEVNKRVLRECFCSSSEGLGDMAKLTGTLNENMLNNTKNLKEVLCLKRSECIQTLRKHLCSGTDISRIGLTIISPEVIEKLCLSHAKLVFSTVSSSAKGCMSMAGSFDCLIIDEAAQLTEAESTIALQIRGLRQAFLIGDPNQLPATVISKLSQNAGYGRSLFERLKDSGHPVHLLNTQYRMHPLISKFPNMEFYGSSIMDGPNVKMETYGNVYLESEMYGKYAFVNVADGTEEEDNVGKSKRNIVEAAVVLHILSKLYKVCACRE
ncbi:hypothetical protein KI387_033187, partial [Taxus chinensis]